MPPPIAIALLKAVASPPHPSPRFHGKKSRSPDQDRRRWMLRLATNPPQVIFPPATSTSAAGREISWGSSGNRFRARGLARFPERWWMRITSGRGVFGAGEKGFLPPSRKLAGGGLERERERNGWVGGGIAAPQQTMDTSNYHDHREDGGEEVPMSSGSSDGKRQQRLMTIPTILTLGRVAAVPLLVSTFHMDGRWATTTTTIIFLAAAITDWLDGYIARKMRLGTIFGAFLDPVADKLMVAATLVLLCTRPLEPSVFGQAPWLLTVPSIAIIGREITMSAVREWAASQNSKLLEAVAVNNLGKWKTATQMTALTILMATRDSSLSGSGVLVTFGVVLLYISSGLAIWSLAVYMKKIWRVLLK